MNRIWAIVALAALAYGLIYLVADAQPQQAPDLPLDATLLRLDRQALDQAYREQAQKLFTVWLTQRAGDTRQISDGLRIARRAYNQAALQITKREQQLIDRDGK